MEKDKIMKYCKLIRIDFKNTENIATTYELELGIFLDKKSGLTAHGSCSNWIKKNLNNIRMYLGWNGQVYPQFKIIEGTITE